MSTAVDCVCRVIERGGQTRRVPRLLRQSGSRDRRFGATRTVRNADPAPAGASFPRSSRSRLRAGFGCTRASGSFCQLLFKPSVSSGACHVVDTFPEVCAATCQRCLAASQPRLVADARHADAGHCHGAAHPALQHQRQRQHCPDRQYPDDLHRQRLRCSAIRWHQQQPELHHHQRQHRPRRWQCPSQFFHRRYHLAARFVRAVGRTVLVGSYRHGLR